jgi:hypothetical protein
LKPVGEINVWVEQNQFRVWLAKQKRIGYFAPARVSAPEGTQIAVPGEQFSLALAQIVLRVHLPLMILRVERFNRFGQNFLVLLPIGDKTQV